MNKVLYIILISLFSLTVFSCSDDKEEYSATGTTDDTTTTTESPKFVAVGDSGTVLTSTDGTSWTSRTSGTTSSLIGVTYGNNKFFTMLGTMSSSIGTVLTSSDGISWTSSSATCSSCGTNNVSLNDVTYKE